MISTLRNYTFIILFLASFFLILGGLGSILYPFLWGLLLSYFLRPLVILLRNKGVAPVISSAFFSGCLYIIFISICLGIIPSLRYLSFSLSHQWMEYREYLWGFAQPWLEHFSLSPRFLQIQDSLDAFINLLTHWAGRTLLEAWQNGVAIAKFCLTLMMVPLISFYFSKDWERFWSGLMRWIPIPLHAAAIRILGQVENTFSQYLRGQIMVCAGLSIYYMVILTILGLNLGWLLGLLMGLFAFIPYLAFGSGLVACLLIGLFQDGSWSYEFAILIFLLMGQILESAILTPLLIGKKTGMHPLWILFIVLAGGALKGFWGVLLALPIGTILLALIRVGKDFYLKSSFYQGSPLISSEDEK